MKRLWQRVWELSRQHTVLWLPVVGAALLSCGWAQLRKSAIHQILPWILRARQGHFVLGGTFPTSGNSTAGYGVIYLASFFITTLCEYADICCYVIAMLIIAHLLGKLMTDATHDKPYIGFSVARHGLGVLWLSLLVYLLALASSALVFLPATFYPTSRLWQPLVTITVVLVMYSALAFFITPVALRLLARAGGAQIGLEEVAIGRKCSLLVGVAISLLSAVQLSIAGKLHVDHAQREAFGIVGTIVTALPYVPLFLALSLISMKDFKLVGPTNPTMEVEQTTPLDDDGAFASPDA